MLDLLEEIIGTYTYRVLLSDGSDAVVTDWAWIMAAAFLLLVVWGIIIILRSVISRV